MGGLAYVLATHPLAPYARTGVPWRTVPGERTETTRNIPDTTVALKEGSNVLSSDGDHVGDVERLFLEPDSNKVSHFLVSQGLLFKDRKLVPAHWVSAIEEDQVHLAVPSRLLERLPSYQE